MSIKPRKLRNCTLLVPLEVHAAVKSACAYLNCTIVEYYIQAAKERLARENAGGKRPAVE